jgi:type I restriction enzyme, S subunit
VLHQVHRPVAVQNLQKVRFAGVRWYTAGVYKRDTVPAAKVKTKTLDRIAVGDIVYNRMWATKSSFGVVGLEADGCLVTNDFPIFLPQNDGILAEYVSLLFHWERFRRLAALAATGTTERRRLNERDFVNIQLPVPPLYEQRRIVDLIEALDDTIAATELVVRRTAALYRQNHVRLRPPDVGHQPLSVLVAGARSGGTPSRKGVGLYGGDIPWVKSGEVNNPCILKTEETITEAAVRESSAWLVPAGAILVAMYGATAAQVGRLGVAACTNQAVLALVPDPARIDSRYLYHLLRSDADRLKTLASGAAQPNLSKGVIMAQEYPMPNLETQRSLGAELEAIHHAQILAAGAVSALEELRSNLLTTLLSGQHEIPESYDDTMGA